ncbi:phosphoenolpyruvate synthase, partial [Thermococci archaeon]
MEYKFIKWFEELRKEDVPLVGGKGANLGEMTSAGIPIPPGFCVTAEAYKYFVENVKVEDGRTLQEWIMDVISKTNVDDSKQLQENTAKIREKIISMEMPEEIASEIEQAYKKLSQRF